eukprot:GILK01007453.1.p1 GENE.GILK01007453.1~~GILK01007453.1.p1  ORF type:complete len:165 (-),score=15.23 GILK01007453.1:172-666(-)
MTARSRLVRELQDLSKHHDNDIVIGPVQDQLFHWRGWIRGPSATPFEGGHFQLDFRIPSTYPLAPPAVKFLTKIFHPNMNFETGEICLDILKTDWTPAWTLQAVCRAIISLLAHPNADSPLNCDCGNLVRGGDMRGYTSMARMYTTEFATVFCPDYVNVHNNTF